MLLLLSFCESKKCPLKHSRINNGVLGENSGHSSNEQILLNVRGFVQTHGRLRKEEIQLLTSLSTAYGAHVRTPRCGSKAEQSQLRPESQRPSQRGS